MSEVTNAPSDGVGHEIRTLVSAVVGLSDLLQRDAHDERSRRRLGQLCGAVQELANVIDDLLGRSGPPIGERTLRSLPLRLGSLPYRVLPTTGLRVLLVEDDPLSQEILCDMIEWLGCEVLIAADGSEALDLFRAGGQDLILMDVRMPGLGGVEAARRIRALPAAADIPIIGLSAGASSEDRQRCLAAGMNEFLCKPISQEQLRQVLLRWTSQGRVSISAMALRETDGDATDDAAVEAGLLAAMVALPGIRLDTSWRDSTSRLRSYQALLVHFVQTQAAEVAQMRLHLETGRADAARAAAHSLAGAAGMVGARSVMERAHAVETALRQGCAPQDLLAICGQCESEIARLAKALEALPRPLPTQAEGVFTPR